MPNLFADLIPDKPAQSGGFFDDLVPKASFGNVAGGAASSPSFAGVQSGSATTQAKSFAPFGVEEGQGITGSDIGQAVAELPNAAYQGLKKGSGYVGKTAGLAAAGAAGLFDDLVGTNTQDTVFKHVVAPYDVQEQQAGQELGKMHLPGQIVGGIASAAPDVALGLASGGETLIPRAAPLAESLTQHATRLVADATEQGLRMSGPLAEKAAGDAYSNRIAQGGTVAEATGDAIKAIASTSLFGVTGQAAVGSLPSRVAQGAAAGAATGEAVRELEGGQFNPVEFGVNAAMGGAFAVHGDAPRSPREATRGEADTTPMEGSGPLVETPPRASTEPTEASGRVVEDTAQPRELSTADLTPEELAAFQRQTEPKELNPEDLSPEERQAFGMFDDLIENNASGESAASLEAQNRFRDEQDAGQHRMILNRDGSVTPIVTADGVDYKAKDGQIIVQANIGDKPWTILDHGDVPRGIAEGRVNAAKGSLDRAAMERTKPDEEITLSSEDTPRNEVPPTSTKNATVEAERTAEGRDPIIKEAAKDNETSVREAQDELARNPAVVDGIVDRLTSEGPKAVSTKDEAILLVEKTRLRNAREEAAKKASDPNATEEQKAQAKTEWNRLESRINNIDKATTASGTEWGRFGQLRQRQMREDFSLAAMESRERVARGRPLNEAEAAQLKAHADKIAELQDALDKTTSNSEVFSQVEREATKERKIRIRNIERPTLERLRVGAEESRKALESMFRRASAGLDPTALVHLTRIGMYHIARGAYKVADFARAMRDDLKTHYDRIKDQIPEIHKEALAAHAKETIQSVVDKAGGKYTHKDVYEVAKAHIQSGVHGEDAVMAATAKSLDVPERMARALFSEYGKAKFASKDAIKTELREIRQLTQIQESIDRLTEGKPALKSGVQRDPPTAEVREKRRKLNDLLKAQEKKTPPSDEERLRTYQQMRLKNVTNQIEDINRQLANKKKDERTPTPDDTPELKALKKERDDLNSTLSRYTNPPPAVNPKDPYAAKNKVEQARLKKEIFDINRRLEERDFGKKAGVMDKPDAETLKLREQKADLIAKYKRLQSPPEAIYPKDPNALVQKSLEKRITELKDKIAKGDYTKTKRIERDLNKSNLELSYQLSKLKQQFGERQFEIEQSKRPTIKKLFGNTREGINLARALQTSFDFSAVLRQGGFVALGHPVLAAKSIVPMLKAFANEKNAFDVQEKIAHRHNARLYEKSGLELTKANDHHLTKLEEQYMSRWIGKLPTGLGGGLVRGSERAFKTFLNKLRADTFDALAGSLSKSGIPTLEEAKAIANYINVATGRGHIGVKGSGAVGLNTLFFAPRLVASRFNLLWLQPLYGGTARTRKLIAKEYARYLMGISVVYTLGAMAHAAVGDKDKFIETDPRSSNFGKMKFGNTYIDPLSGMSQVIALLGKEAAGETKTQKGLILPLRPGGKYSLPDAAEPKYGKPTAANVVFNFARTKLAPVPGAILNIATRKNVIGQPTTPVQEAKSLVTPLSAQNVMGVMKENGITGGSAITLLELLGMGVNYRDPNQKWK